MERIYNPGQIIIREGGLDKNVFLLKSGKLGILKDDRVILEISEPNVIFGEMSIILNQPRSATVKALTLCTVEMYPGAFDTLVSKHPQMMKLILITLTERLAATTDRLYHYMTAQSSPKKSTQSSYLVSLENVIAVENQIIQRVMDTISNETLIAAMLGTTTEAREKFFANMSARRRTIVREDMRIALAVCTQKAIELAQQQVLEAINELIKVKKMTQDR